MAPFLRHHVCYVAVLLSSRKVLVFKDPRGPITSPYPCPQALSRCQQHCYFVVLINFSLSLFSVPYSNLISVIYRFLGIRDRRISDPAIRRNLAPAGLHYLTQDRVIFNFRPSL